MTYTKTWPMAPIFEKDRQHPINFSGDLTGVFFYGFLVRNPFIHGMYYNQPPGI